MKSAVFYGEKKLSVEERKRPVVSMGEVLIEVKACGICGTDVHIFEGDEGAAPTPENTVLGHEFAGIVTEIGEGVKELRVGDRVAVDPNALCGSCYFCQRGEGHYCEHMVGTGTTVDGGFSQFCLVTPKQLYLLAETTSFSQGAMAEPLSCCIHGVDLCQIKTGDTVVVVGGGMIGLLNLQLAKLSGASTIILIEPIEEKRQQGLSLGATLTIDPFSENPKDVLSSRQIKNVQVVIECVGRPETIKQSIELAGKQGMVMMFGLTKPDEEITIKPFEFFQKEITLKSSFINPYTMGRAIDLINQGRVDVASMIEEVVPLENLPEILGNQKLRSKGKYIVNPWL
ncbi:zinc-dependent alcohol dehydrogenase family protein [uncultured Vagococcus sp.]|uniref:zinc-dependent alcohol dehydrogenase family protein n=1 Tax=uncultured Vagococcus sp. TaxID=189676 RepID=UPI0028D74153|nr:zinc-dependent alcohol dehydrogenase family protein [uncultured Vagococcus sp.]